MIRHTMEVLKIDSMILTFLMILLFHTLRHFTAQNLECYNTRETRKFWMHLLILVCFVTFRVARHALGRFFFMKERFI